MNAPTILDQLRNATTTKAKAALVAEAVIETLPTEISTAVLRLGLLFRFTTEVVASMLGADNGEQVDEILNLPFIEKLSWGYTFHDSTRMGLLEKYRQFAPEEIRAAYDYAEPVLFGQSTSPEATIALIYGYVLTGQGQKAEEALLRLFESLSNRPFALSVSQFANIPGILDEAESLSISNNKGLTPNYWLIKGQLHLGMRKMTLVIRDCSAAIELDATNVEAFALRGLALALEGNMTSAYADVRHSVELKPNGPGIRTRAAIHAINKNLREAIFDYNRALENDQKDFGAYLGRAQAYMEEGKLTRALKDYDSALKLLPRELDANFIYVIRGDAFSANKDWRNAINEYTVAIDASPVSGAYRRRGDCFYQLGRYRQALSDYESALKLAPDNEWALIGKGKVFIKNKEYEPAIIELEQAIKVNPEIADAYIELWKVYSFLKRDEDAGLCIQRFFALDEVKKVEYMKMAFVARARNQFELAIKAVRRILDSEPEDPTAQNTLGYLLIQTGDYFGAKQHADLSLMQNPEEPIYLINLGVVEMCLGDKSSALHSLRRALKETTGKGDTVKLTRTWLQTILEDFAVGLKRFEREISRNPAEDDLYNIRDWTNALSAHDQDLSNRLEKVLELVIDALNSRGSQLL